MVIYTERTSMDEMGSMIEEVSDAEEITTFNGKVEFPESVTVESMKEFLDRVSSLNSWGLKGLVGRTQSLIETLELAGRKVEVIKTKLANINHERSPAQKKGDVKISRRHTAVKFFAVMDVALLHAYAKSVNINRNLYDSVEELRAALVDDYVERSTESEDE